MELAVHAYGDLYVKGAYSRARDLSDIGDVSWNEWGVGFGSIITMMTKTMLFAEVEYRWVLEHKVANIIERLREASKTKTIVLLDYNTNCDVDDPTTPLSHAYLVKAYAEGLYPYDDIKFEEQQK